VDGTLQPYSISVPEGYRPDKRYPLLVWLHGSGQDDRDELTRPWLPAGCLLVAPRGRGTSTWYAIDHAQDDIRETVEDVMRQYSVDRSRVVLAGFSMGGYGVYRTQVQDPSRYRALAVFSGSARARGVSTAGAPDFLAAGTDLAAFARIPLFVFHGGKDRNCPIEETRALVDRLKTAGADVTFVLEQDKGHESAGASTLAAFQGWFDRVLAAPHSSRSAFSGSSRDARRAGK
jgi:dipeptidyl aminopeptidase/acylaminoacyl peptidase